MDYLAMGIQVVTTIPITKRPFKEFNEILYIPNISVFTAKKSDICLAKPSYTSVDLVQDSTVVSQNLSISIGNFGTLKHQNMLIILQIHLILPTFGGL